MCELKKITDLSDKFRFSSCWLFGLNRLQSCVLLLRAPVRKNQTYRGKGGKFDFFHILMSDRLGYN